MPFPRLLDTRPGDCRFPVDEDASVDMRVCGARTGDEDRSFCTHHHRIVYLPSGGPIRVPEQRGEPKVDAWDLAA